MPKLSENRAAAAARLAEIETLALPRAITTMANAATEPPNLLGSMSADTLHKAIADAEDGETSDLFSIYRDILAADTHLSGIIDTRFVRVLNSPPKITPASESPADKAAAEAIQAAIGRVDFQGLCQSLLWGAIFPLSVVERTYKAASAPGIALDWGYFRPVPWHLLTWRNLGRLQVQIVDPHSRQMTGEVRDVTPTRFIIHRGHMMSSPDCWGGPMRGLAWWSFLKVLDREWWTRFLDRFGTPFPLAKYDKADDKSRAVLERAIRLSHRLGGIVVTKSTHVELIQAQAQGADAFQKFWEVCGREQSRRVLGQTLSTDAQPTGMGSGTADLQGSVREDLTQWDRSCLADTIQRHLFHPWLRINGLLGSAPMVSWGTAEADDNEALARVLAELHKSNIQVADESLPTLGQRLGLTLQRTAPSPTPPLTLSTRIPSISDLTPDAAMDYLTARWPTLPLPIAADIVTDALSAAALTHFKSV
jgi:phage gp29-like protein